MILAICVIVITLETSMYSTDQRIQIVKMHYKHGECFAVTTRKLRSLFGRRNVPDESTIRRLIQKFEKTGSVLDIKHSVRCRPVRSQENINAARESVEGNPRTSVRHRSQQLEISNGSLHKILHEDLNLHPYKVQLTQKLEACDHTAREHFANFVLQNQELDPMFAKRIIFSDELVFGVVESLGHIFLKTIMEWP